MMIATKCIFLLLIDALLSCAPVAAWSFHGPVNQNVHPFYYKNPRNVQTELCVRDDNQAQLQARNCLRKCTSDEDCKSKRKKCLCDGACGMSCIKPGLT